MGDDRAGARLRIAAVRSVPYPARMSQETLTLLQNQFSIASQLTHYHLDTLTTEECLWRPTQYGLHVHQQSDGRWVADWPDREDYGMGAASIGWLTWHMGFWWSMVLDHSFGDATLGREAVLWPGSAEETIAWISGLEARWIDRVGNLSAADLAATERTRWPFQDRPFAEVVGWATVELTKNASEIGYARFLYGSRG